MLRAVLLEVSRRKQGPRKAHEYFCMRLRVLLGLLSADGGGGYCEDSRCGGGG